MNPALPSEAFGNWTPAQRAAYWARPPPLRYNPRAEYEVTTKRMAFYRRRMLLRILRSG